MKLLDKIDLSKRLKKAEYKDAIDAMEIRLGELQREAKRLSIPVLIVCEGWDAAGKGTIINKFILNLDPRGVNLYPTFLPNEDERLRPFLWRFWTRVPARGRLAIFDRSWYGRVLSERIDRAVKKKVWSNAYEEINSFERQLVDSGYVIIKCFFHISKGEQKKRYQKLQAIRSMAWRVTKAFRRNHKNYNKFVTAIEEMLAKTDTDYAPWTVIESEELRFGTIKFFQTVIDVLENKIRITLPAAEKKRKRKQETTGIPQDVLSTTVLDKIELTQSLEKDEYVKDLKKYQAKIRELEHEIYSKRIPVVIVYEGWDAAGKGGNIKRLVAGMDPRGYDVIPVAAPNDAEKERHYLWRFWKEIPKAGHIALFDRSWYGRIMVERVEGFSSEEEWKRAYKEINEMEEILTNFGTVLIKFWLHIDKDEQLRRFKQRESIPYKKWKITPEDWRNREKWDSYETAVNEMLYRTSTYYAPWTIVESNCKWFARIKTLKTVITEVGRKLKSM